MKFTRTERRTVTLLVEGWNHFHIEVNYSSDKPDVWEAQLIDYDGSCGAIGYFSSEQEIIDNIDAFFATAMPLYDKKYAKYGEMPIIKIVGGKMEFTIRDDRYAYDEREYD